MTALHKITHHPGEDLLATYVAGTLDEASALAMATHLSLCPACRRQVATLEALGGSLIDALPETPLAADSLAATLARAKAPASAGEGPPPAQPVQIKRSYMLPAPLRRYVGGDIEAVKWRRIGPGIDQLPLVSSDGVTARLLRIAPGRSVFDHGHGGVEMTLCLNGSYESMGTHFARGDIEILDENVTHRPVAGSEDVCICLAVTDAPLRFDNWLGRLMQPFIGI